MTTISSNKTKIVVIVGPTASGKSDLAVELALREKGEIISADSRQVYRGMDIGTGKITKAEMKGISHHLLDVASPQTDYNVSKFKKAAQRKIDEIAKRGNLPILVGGTGFWIDAVVYDLEFSEVKPDKKLRGKLDSKTVLELFAQLAELDPKRAGNIDSKNKRRLIRALEIVLTTQKPVPIMKRESKYDARWYGITIDQDTLQRRIRKRLIKRLDLGMVREVELLHKKGLSWKRMDEFGLEYRYISRMLLGHISFTEMIHQLEHAIVQYSKRQFTWWRRNKDIKWISEIGEIPALH